MSAKWIQGRNNAPSVLTILVELTNETRISSKEVVLSLFSNSITHRLVLK